MVLENRWGRELIVLHSLPGGAQPIAEAVDSEGWPEVVGTIGGENHGAHRLPFSRRPRDADRAHYAAGERGVIREAENGVGVRH